jgi:hypothetical protein
MMAKSTFHEILLANLEENSSPTKAAPKTAFIPWEWSFAWQAPCRLSTSNHRHAYRRPLRTEPIATPPSEAAPPPPPEYVMALSGLPTEERTAALRLIELGAIEITTGLSVSRLKGAYRRLAKRFHPDRPGGSTDLFREIKSQNDRLKTWLSTQDKKAV